MAESGQEYVSAVSGCYTSPYNTLLTETEEFALTEASCAIIRIIQTFPELRLPPEIPSEEKGALIIVVMSAEGCKVLLQ
jgi:hypothetical protein